MIARRENVFARNTQKTGQLAERCSFVIISVTKTQINCVALVIQLRMLGPRSFDKVRDALHFFVVLRNQTFEPFAIVKETRFSFLSYEIHELSNDRLNRRKQLRVIARAACVPVAKRFPVVSVSSRTKNIALSREDEVRADRECEIREAGFEQINRTARVDRPDRAGFLQFTNEFHTLRVENGFANAGNERPVEIDAQQFDW